MLRPKNNTRDLRANTRCPLEAAASIAIDYNVAALARLIAKSPTTLSNKLNLNIDSHVLTLPESIAITDITEDLRIISAWADHLGLVLVKAPVIQLRAKALPDYLVSMQASIGPVASVISKLKEESVTEQELSQLITGLSETIKTLMELKLQVEQMAVDHDFKVA